MDFPTMKRPSAILPLAMSIAALTMVVGRAALFGVTHEVDEGTAAHIFQLLMAAQVPIVAYFVLTWLPRAPKRAAVVLAVQAGAALAAIAAVCFLT